MTRTGTATMARKAAGCRSGFHHGRFDLDGFGKPFSTRLSSHSL